MILRFEKDKKEEGKEKSKETVGKKTKSVMKSSALKKCFCGYLLVFVFVFFTFLLRILSKFKNYSITIEPRFRKKKNNPTSLKKNMVL